MTKALGNKGIALAKPGFVLYKTSSALQTAGIILASNLLAYIKPLLRHGPQVLH